MIMGNLIKFFAQIFHLVIWLYIIVIIVRSILSWAGQMPRNDFIMILRRLTDPLFRLVHRLLPFTIIGGIDISPVIILVLLHFLDTILYNGLMNYALVLMRGGG